MGVGMPGALVLSKLLPSATALRALRYASSPGECLHSPLCQCPLTLLTTSHTPLLVVCKAMASITREQPLLPRASSATRRCNRWSRTLGTRTRAPECLPFCQRPLTQKANTFHASLLHPSEANLACRPFPHSRSQTHPALILISPVHAMLPSIVCRVLLSRTGGARVLPRPSHPPLQPPRHSLMHNINLDEGAIMAIRDARAHGLAQPRRGVGALSSEHAAWSSETLLLTQRLPQLVKHFSEFKLKR